MADQEMMKVAREPSSDSWVWSVPNTEDLIVESRKAQCALIPDQSEIVVENHEAVVPSGVLIVALTVSSMIGILVAILLYINGFSLVLSFFAYMLCGAILFFSIVIAAFFVASVSSCVSD